MAKARLIKGQDYVVKGKHFKNGIALTIDDELKEYLSGNSQFEIIVDDQEETEADIQDENKDSNDSQDSKKTTGARGKSKQEGEE